MVWPCFVDWCFTRVNLIAPFPLGQNCPRKMTMTVTMTVENMIDKEGAGGFSNHFFATLQFGFTLSFLIKCFLTRLAGIID